MVITGRPCWYSHPISLFAHIQSSSPGALNVSATENGNNSLSHVVVAVSLAFAVALTVQSGSPVVQLWTVIVIEWKRTVALRTSRRRNLYDGLEPGLAIAACRVEQIEGILETQNNRVQNP